MASAVPCVATMRKPRSLNNTARPPAPGLSESVTVMNTVPSVGRCEPAAACAFANAVGKSGAMPMTSPVERISGPSTASEPAKRSNGRTASFTETWPAAHRVGGQVEVLQPLAEHEPAGHLRERHARSPWTRTAPSATRAGWPR